MKKIISADRIITGDGRTVIDKASIVIENNKIVEVGRTEKVLSQYSSLPVETYSGCTLLPGLIDLHVHISSLYQRPDAAEMAKNLGQITLMAVKHLNDAASRGITTLRSVGEAFGLGSAIRSGYRKGYISGPRYFASERSLCITGGHGSTGEVAKLEVDGVWEVRKAVRGNIKEGADWIKVMSSHRSHHSEFSLEELVAIADEAHRLGKKCCIHAGTVQSIDFAIAAKFDSIEHGPFLKEELAEKAINNGVAWIPTAYVYYQAIDYIRKLYQNPTEKQKIEIDFLDNTVAGYKENLLRNYKKGVLIGTGTDICFPEMFITPIDQELKVLNDIGLTTLEALQCATENGARILGKDTEFGKIQTGLMADVLIVSGNPVEKIEDVKNVEMVLCEGKQIFTSGNNVIRC